MAIRLSRLPFLRACALGSLLALAALVTSLTGARPAHAAPAFTVGSTVDAHWNHVAGTCAAVAPGSPCTLRAAIEVAADPSGAGATITVPGGVYKLTLGALPVSTSMTIVGAGGSNTIVDGQTLDRVFTVTGGTVAISALRVQQGNAGTSGGGGIANAGTLTLTNVVVASSRAAAGGGIFNVGSLTTAGGFVVGNTATRLGGGIFTGGDHGATLRGTTVQDNQAEIGGGIADANRLTVAGGWIVANQAAGGGGVALFNLAQEELTAAMPTGDEHAAATISTTTIDGNAASTAGGGILLMGAVQLDLGRSTVSRNVVSLREQSQDAVIGGGIANVGGNERLINVTLNQNTADGEFTKLGGVGGAIFQGQFGETIRTPNGDRRLALSLVAGLDRVRKAEDERGTTLDLVTLAGNAATVGGGIFRLNGDMDTRNTIIAGNTATNATTANCSSSITTFSGDDDGGYNLESANTCGFQAARHDLVGTDPKLGALGDHFAGGSTLHIGTMALLDGSPAIDAANPKCPAVAGEKSDERGVTRPQGSACDIGAYEVLPKPSPSPSPSSSPSPSPTGDPLPPVTGTGTGLAARQPAGGGPSLFLAGLGLLAVAGAGLVARRGSA